MGDDDAPTPRSTGDSKPSNPAAPAKPANPAAKIPEVGGRGGLDPTRYGDWEKDGRCVDF